MGVPGGARQRAEEQGLARRVSGTRSAPKTGCAVFRLHDLRHTHASVALRQGETVLTIARLLGHRNPETTLKYTHLADKMVMDAAETVGTVLEA